MERFKLGAALAILALVAMPAMAQDPDVTTVPPAPPEGPLVEIPAMTVLNSWIDMDLVVPGPPPGGNAPTNLAAINAAGTGAGGNIAGISMTFNAQPPVGVYNTQVQRGVALGGGPPPSGTSLYLISPTTGQFTSVADMTINLGMPSTEFGWSLGDWSGPMNIQTWSGAVQNGSLAVSFSGSPNPHFVQHTSATFDRVVITLLPEFPGGNWVVPDLYVQVPEPATMSLLGLGALALLRRRVR